MVVWFFIFFCFCGFSYLAIKEIIVCAVEGENWLITQMRVGQWLMHIDMLKGSVHLWLTASFVCSIYSLVHLSTSLPQCYLWTRDTDKSLLVETKHQEFGDGFISVWDCSEQSCELSEGVDWGEIPGCEWNFGRLLQDAHLAVIYLSLHVFVSMLGLTCAVVCLRRRDFWSPIRTFPRVACEHCLWNPFLHLFLLYVINLPLEKPCPKSRLNMHNESDLTSSSGLLA